MLLTLWPGPVRKFCLVFGINNVPNKALFICFCASPTTKTKNKMHTTITTVIFSYKKKVFFSVSQHKTRFWKLTVFLINSRTYFVFMMRKLWWPHLIPARVPHKMTKHLTDAAISWKFNVTECPELYCHEIWKCNLSMRSSRFTACMLILPEDALFLPRYLIVCYWCRSSSFFWALFYNTRLASLGMLVNFSIVCNYFVCNHQLCFSMVL